MRDIDRIALEFALRSFPLTLADGEDANWKEWASKMYDVAAVLVAEGDIRYGSGNKMPPVEKIKRI
jgi:hypothetical protein